MARKVTTVLSLRDNYTAVIKKARRYTNAFDKDVQKMTARLDKASKKKHDLKVKNSAAMKALSAVEKKIAPMRNTSAKSANAMARSQSLPRHHRSGVPLRGIPCSIPSGSGAADTEEEVKTYSKVWSRPNETDWRCLDSPGFFGGGEVSRTPDHI